MDQQAIIAGWEARAKACGIPISELCRRAGVHPTSFSRWKQSEKNPRPFCVKWKSVNSIEHVLSEMEARPTQTAA